MFTKRIHRCMVAATAAAVLSATPAFAAQTPKFQIVVDGNQTGLSAYASKNGMAMTDFSVASALGMTYTVDGDQVRFTRDGVTKVYTMGGQQTDDSTVEIPTEIKNGKTYISLSFLAQEFGLDLDLNAATKIISASTDADEAINVAGVPAPSYDYTQANQLPMTGYFEKNLSVTLPDGSVEARTVKFYISEDAGIRPYFTIISVPEGMDTTRFLKESGWFDIADQNDECLFVLEPGEDGKWGSFEDEYAYVTAAISFYKSPAAETASLDTGKTTNYFSSYGMNYFVGYGGGAPALEAWAANNPGFMISQVYVDSTGVEQSVFDQAAAKYYDGDEASNNVALNIDPSEWIYYDELPIPTWFINSSGQSSMDYWKYCSDCVSQPVSDSVLGQVFNQSESSDAWQTDVFGPISKVAVLEDAGYDAMKHTQQIYDFLTSYTRYDNTCAFASQLAPRVRAAQLEEQGLLTRNQVVVEEEPREYLVYVPANSQEKYPDGAPVVFVWAGNTQSDLLFMDATSWRILADQNGFICVYPSEQYNASSSVTVSHKNTVEFNLALRDALKTSGLNIDWTRVYCTGQSAGSSATNTIASFRPELYAAYASTSGPATITDTVSAGTSGIPAQDDSALAGTTVPNYLLVARGDMPTRTGSLFDDDINQLDLWAAYFLKVNQGGTVNDYDSLENSGPHDRFTTYTWNNSQDIPMTKMTMDSYRNHNCSDYDMPLMWEYLSHFSADWDEASGQITRYYSPSAFEKDDAVVIR